MLAAIVASGAAGAVRPGAEDEPAVVAASFERTQGPDACGRLRADGRLIRCEDGSPFRWRGVTGFRLVHHVATGDEAAARRYLAWARETGFNVIRVLSTAALLFDLEPAAGRAALPKALALAREFGLYVEVAAAIDTAEREYDWPGHARDVAGICAAAINCVFEFANEPGHGVQDVRLHDMAAVDRFAADAVAGFDLLWTAGPSWGSDVADVPSGAFVVRHLDRGGTPWEMAGRLAEFEALSARLNKPVVSNEPIGFDEVDGSSTGRQRIVDCDAALVFGVLARVLEVATTFHLQAGLQNEEPGPVQQQCAEDYVRGTRLVPDRLEFRRLEPGAAHYPVASAHRDRIVYAAAAGRDALVVAFGASGGPDVAWQGVREADHVLDRASVDVWRVRLDSPGSGGSLWESNPPLPPEAGGDRF